METVCRLCAKEKPSKQLVHSIEDRTSNIQQKLIDCCRWDSIVATEFETLPKKICNPCYRKLEMSWTFAESVAEAQQQIFSTFTEQKPVLPPIEHVNIKDICIKDELIEANELNATEMSDDFDEPLEPMAKLELVLEHEDINPMDDDEMPNLELESTSNGRPKRKPKPLQEKFQAGTNKVKSKSNEQPKKMNKAKNTDSGKDRKKLQKLPPSNSCVCDTCGKDFMYPDSLKRHMKIHSDIR